jgi:LCP family protein required for cell wall assembly
MIEHKKFKKPKHQPASIDGIVVGSRGLAAPTVSSYQPNRGKETPSLEVIGRRSDGFHSARQAPGSLGQSAAESAETKALLDEPIILDDDTGKKKKKHYYRHKHPRLRKILKRSGLLTAVLIIGVGGFLFWKLERDLASVFHGNIFSVFRPVTKLKGEDQGRVNILLAGNSADDPGHSGANLTDSIMLISLDTANNTGYLLSIPRDMWVNYDTNNCPYGNQGRINGVYQCGQAINFHQNGYASGGMGLLEKVVSQDFGVGINYYSLINYGGLRDAVNAVGGIEFTVNSPDSCGLYDGNIDYATHGPLVKLSNGVHLLKGEQALDLARARGDPPYPSCGYENSDYTRTQNQRQELLDLKSKALSVGVLSNPAKISSLLDAVGNNLQTDFQANEILRLYSLTKKIPNSSIQSVGLAGNNGSTNYLKGININGADVLIPVAGEGDFSNIQNYIQRLNSNNPVVKENASVVILNGSNANGLALQTSTTLTNKGLNVLALANDTAHQTTVIVDLNPQKTATKSYLQKTFKVTATSNTTANPEAKNYNADFVIILGKDAASSNTSPQ